MKPFMKGISLFLLTLILLIMMFTISCSREATFEEFVISSEIDDDYNAPIYPREEYVQDRMKGKVFAVIKVIGVKPEDSFKFVWINEDTNEILFEDVNNYSSQEKGFLKGYFLSFIDVLDISLDVGGYKVDFYHNNKLEGTVYFKVRSS